MAENKTKATETDVDAYLDSLSEPRRSDAKALAKLMQAVSREKPKMWGSAIVGFGSRHYRYESGREGDMPLLCFSPRKAATVVYNMGSTDKALLGKLGKHELKGGCLHIKKFSELDAGVLKTILTQSLEKTSAHDAK